MTAGEWLAAMRPRTLGAAVVPVAVGLALASQAGVLDVPVGLLTLVVAILIQITTNFANDYFDAIHGADGPDRLGPVRVSQAGPEAASAMGRATVVVTLLAAAAGVVLVVHGGLPILLIGLASLVCAIAYTGGPYPLAYHGLGEPFVFVFFGPVAVLGTLLLQRAPITDVAIIASIFVGCLATAILVVNNLRDVASDERAGKRTLAVRWGATAMRVLYVTLVGAPFVGVALLGPRLALLALPLAVMEAVSLRRRTGRALNQSLAGTARVHVAFGALLAIGVLW
jgi:1,4-dihydroxy-2-naphthoate octaprenyltransferase